ncbi:pectin esterase [Streptomyces harbinensis]|uniref:pectinesterase family protein n=1 Tax=Streptomyces harbinensis TaxID=1176198 RepID=UPI00159067B2|nr:pectinesterase family protein [Streptomyces harbinensis]QKV67657.1 pectin esterase [Streptomyces harbinensis]
MRSRTRTRTRTLAVPLLLASALLATTGLTTPAAATAPAPTHLTVAADGSAAFTGVQAAIDAVPAGNTSPVTITVQPGVYRETVVVPSNKPHIRLVGSTGRAADVTIVYNNSSGTPKPGGGTYGTSGSATFMADADDFEARHLTFANDFDELAHADQPNHQAVALRTRGDRIVLANIAAHGDQDTLLLDSANKDRQGRVHISDSLITGNVDFIFGRATAVITDSVIEVTRRPDGTSAGYVTAPSTAAQFPGFLITDSVITGNVGDGTYYLGRPWYAGGDATLHPQVTIRDTHLSAAVRATPWTDMSGFPWQGARFAEYHNTGPGSAPPTTNRPHLTDQQAAAHTPATWLGGWTP